MSDDALERLKRRQRPSVPTRDAALEASTPMSPDTSISTQLEFKKAEVNLEIQTKQTTMRLEQNISNRLQELCRQYNVSREVFIEALLVHFDSDPQTQETVVTEALSRHEHRLQIANRKRAQTMVQKYCD